MKNNVDDGLEIKVINFFRLFPDGASKEELDALRRITDYAVEQDRKGRDDYNLGKNTFKTVSS
ncbi:MAG TPA: hypothetical protein VFA52_04315 [Candidatus Paceibacterota bacterium]|jgi:hypothetical protein|nr:hypothetical protein [Candidatus Paceibacterota bacterium]